MKHILTFLLYFIFLAVFSQSRTSFGIMASPDWTSVNGGYAKNTGGTEFYSIPGFSAGITIYKKLTKHFFINSGVWYAKKGVKYTVDVAYIDSLGHIFLFTPGMKYHKYQDLEIPILLNYKINTQKIQFTLSLGAILAFGLKETITTKTFYSTFSHNITSPQTAPERVYLSMGFGVLYKFNEKYSLLIEPNYKIDVKGILTAVFDDTHSFGIRTTFIYKFKY